MIAENTSIESARAAYESATAELRSVDRAFDNAQAVLNRLRDEYNAAIDKQTSARRALTAAIANEQQR